MRGEYLSKFIILYYKIILFALISCIIHDGLKIILIMAELYKFKGQSKSLVELIERPYEERTALENKLVSNFIY